MLQQRQFVGLPSEKENMRAANNSLHAPDVLVSLGLAILFTASCIISSLRQGKLSNPPTYDDIVYFVDGATRLQILYDQNFLAVVQDFARNPPHAPLSTLTAMLAFSLFGMHAWAAPVINGIWVFLILLGLRLCLPRQPLAIFATVALVLLSWPLMGFLVMEGRPDFAWGLLTAIGCFYILRTTWLDCPLRNVLIAGLFAGLSLLAKPPIAPLTLTLYGSAAFFASVVDLAGSRFERGLRRHFFRTNLLFLLTTIFVAAPYYVFGLSDTINYIYSVLFGSLSTFGAAAIRPEQPFAYYLWGFGGRMLMGQWFFITAFLMLIAAFVQYRWVSSHRGRIAAIAAWCFIAYLGVTLPAIKYPSFGVVVSGAMLVLFAAALSGILTKIGDFGRQISSPPTAAALKFVLCSILLAFAVMNFRWHIYNSNAGASAEVANPIISAKRFALVEQLVDEAVPRQLSAGQRAIIVVPTVGLYLNPTLLQFVTVQRRISNTTFVDNHASADVAKHLELIAGASDVILSEPGDSEMLPWVPSASVLPEILKAVAHDQDWELRRTFDSVDGKHHILLYHRRPPLRGVRAVSGFLDTEGPYPQWNMGYVQWAVGQEARLDRISDAHSLLHIEAIGSMPDQSIEVNVDGRELGVCRLPNVFEVCEIPIPQELEANKITLHFLNHSTDDQVGRAVLFKRIDLR